MSELSIRLRKPLERTISAGHPWVFRDALERVDAPLGTIATVLSRGGAFVARGYFGEGPIALRVLTTADEPVDTAFFARRIQSAMSLRKSMLPADTDAYRLLHGEGDRLPGVVCDVYGRHAVIQLDGGGARAIAPLVLPSLIDVLRTIGVDHVLERQGRGDEKRVVALVGALPSEPVVVTERGMRLAVNLVTGQKTGMFLDHRESRARVRELSRQQRVLNLYSYTGGFSVAAALGGASSVTSVDVAPAAIDLARENFALNDLATPHNAVCSDVMEFLASEPHEYEIVVADPPSFAPNEASVARAEQSYAALHRGSLARVVDGGLYVAASCSSHISREMFEQTLLQAARESGHVVQVLERSGAPFDHPRLLAFPEGDYLKVLLTRVSRQPRKQRSSFHDTPTQRQPRQQRQQRQQRKSKKRA